MTQCAYACWGIAAGAIAMISHLTGQNIRIYGDFYSNWNTAAQSLLNWALYALIIRNNCIYAAAFHMGCWRALWIRWRFFLALYLVVASTFVVVTL